MMRNVICTELGVHIDENIANAINNCKYRRSRLPLMPLKRPEGIRSKIPNHHHANNADLSKNIPHANLQKEIHEGRIEE